ncbi:MAG: C-terminal binding protein [Anaerolineae bacterium]|nr:C-terminal binding protein [Anaerolineae bacterium]
MAQYKVVITDFGSAENEIEQAELSRSGLDIELIRLNTRVPQELLPHVSDADALIVQWAQINGEVIDALNRCKVISRYGIGVDMVDLAAAGKRGIMVCNSPDYCIEEVATHTMAFLLMLNRNLLPQNKHVNEGKWGSAPLGIEAPMRLSKQSIGVIGLGNIGRAVAERAKCLGLKVIGYDPYLKDDQFANLGIQKASLEELLSEADYVAVHCPLNEETRGLISTTQFGLMKPTAFLINMARGPIVDQPALYTALTNRQIAGAALDVLTIEPPDPNDPLLKLDNVIFSPHTSSWSVDAVRQLRMETARNVVDVLQGRPPRSVVNRKELASANGGR